MVSADWIRGVLYAFEWVNARRNVASDFEFSLIDGSGEIKPRLIQHLSKNASHVEISLSPVHEPETELAKVLHGWLFVYLGVDNSREKNDGPRLVDSGEYFNMTSESNRTVFCEDLAKKIIKFCNPKIVFAARIESDEACLSFPFTRCFVFEGDIDTYFLRLGECF